MFFNSSRIRVTLALSTALILAGCYGSFTATKKIYEFNGTVHDNKVVQSVAMIAMSIIPVYGVAILADALILNSLEFLTGSNPLATGDRLEETDQNGNKVVSQKLDETSGIMTITTAEGKQVHLMIVREGDMISALSPDGKVLAQTDE